MRKYVGIYLSGCGATRSSPSPCRRAGPSHEQAHLRDCRGASRQLVFLRCPVSASDAALALAQYKHSVAIRHAFDVKLAAMRREASRGGASRRTTLCLRLHPPPLAANARYDFVDSVDSDMDDVRPRTRFRVLGVLAHSAVPPGVLCRCSVIESVHPTGTFRCTFKVHDGRWSTSN